MQETKTVAVDSMRRVLTARRPFAWLLFGSLVLAGCGIGKLDTAGKNGAPGSATAKSAAANAFRKKMPTLNTLPKGGPGGGAATKRQPPPDSATSTRREVNDTTEKKKKGMKARFAAFFMNRPARRHKPVAEQAPSQLRGRYAMSDSGDFFVPCNDTTRYGVQGTTEARYLMVEKLRFIVRGLKTPVYAVFTGIYVATKPVAATTAAPANKDATPTAGQRGPAAALPPARKMIFVNKVDTLTTTFPNACRPPNANRSAGG
jgi:hypothetical protein